MDSSCKASGVASKLIVYMRGGGGGRGHQTHKVGGFSGGGRFQPTSQDFGSVPSWYVLLPGSDFLVQNMSGVKRSLLQKDSHVQALWQAFGVGRFLVQKPF